MTFKRLVMSCQHRPPNLPLYHFTRAVQPLHFIKHTIRLAAIGSLG